MNYVLENPVGVDKVIDRIQTFLYDKLDWNPIEVYGRVYKNELDGSIIPQYYKENGEYKPDVFITDVDNNKGNIFFVLNDKHRSIDHFNFLVETKIVFMLNLERIYEDPKQRQDSKAQQHAWNLVKKKNQFTIKSLETGLKTVLKGFELKDIKRADIEPLHVFALVGDLKYNINNC